MIGTVVSAWLLGKYVCPHKDAQNSPPKKRNFLGYNSKSLSTVSPHPGFEVKVST